MGEPFKTHLLFPIKTASGQAGSQKPNYIYSCYYLLFGARDVDTLFISNAIKMASVINPFKFLSASI